MHVPELVNEDTFELVNAELLDADILGFCKDEPPDAITMLDGSSALDWACDIPREHDGAATSADLARRAGYILLESSEALL